MSELLPQHLPEDIEAERSLLATCCAAGAETAATEISFTLTEDDFDHPAHRAGFKALKALVEAQLEVNSLTLKDALDQAGDLARVGGFTGLVDLLSAEEVGRPQVLADLLVRKRKLRQLIRLGAQLVRQAAEEEAPPDADMPAADDQAEGMPTAQAFVATDIVFASQPIFPPQGMFPPQGRSRDRACSRRLACARQAGSRGR